jgi:hypothetical protein
MSGDANFASSRYGCHFYIKLQTLVASKVRRKSPFQHAFTCVLARTNQNEVACCLWNLFLTQCLNCVCALTNYRFIETPFA